MAEEKFIRTCVKCGKNFYEPAEFAEHIKKGCQKRDVARPFDKHKKKKGASKKKPAQKKETAETADRENSGFRKEDQ